jgi:hypothetical protein
MEERCEATELCVPGRGEDVWFQRSLPDHVEVREQGRQGVGTYFLLFGHDNTRVDFFPRRELIGKENLVQRT